MSKATETTKKATSKKEKAVAEQNAATEETVAAETAAPEVQAPEVQAPEVQAPEAPATAETAAPEASKQDESAADKAQEPEQTIADVFSELFAGAVPAGFKLAPEGFGFGLSDEEFEGVDGAGCCGAEITLEDAYEAGVQAGTRRASHPVFGIGIAAPAVAPAPAKPEVALTPINVVDDTTAAFAHLVDLKKLHAVGILTDEEFNAKKADILRHVY